MTGYQDPGPPVRVTEFSISAGETLEVDLRNAAFPLGWSCLPESGATVAHQGANAADPAATDWLDPAEHASITQATRSSEPDPVAWLRWSASGAGAKIAITAAGPVIGTIS